MIKTIQFHSLKEVMALKSSEAIISIRDPRSPLLDFVCCSHIFHCVFSDIERPTGDSQDVIFNYHEARHIINFIVIANEKIKHLDIHCHSGQSRSAAVARFACQLLKLPFDEERGKSFNRLVYRTLACESGLPVLPDVFYDQNDDGADIVPHRREI